MLGAARLGIDQQQIQVAAHAGVAAAVAAENTHPLQAGVLHRHPFGPAGNLVKHMLQLNHRVIRYESLVAQPEASLRGCLDAMHLPMHEGVLHPERNPRIPITLSHSQAREPIYSTSVGRWRQYDWLFGEEWEQLASLACS